MVSQYTLQEFKAYKTLEAYKQFVDGWVQAMEKRNFNESRKAIDVLGRVSLVVQLDEDNDAEEWNLLRMEIEIPFHLF
jgi:hypothetical protein